jgi:hypothetical protein
MGWHGVEGHPEHDGNSGAKDIKDSSHGTDAYGTPGVDGGATSSDGHQTSQAPITHHTHVIGHPACRVGTPLSWLASFVWVCCHISAILGPSCSQPEASWRAC